MVHNFLLLVFPEKQRLLIVKIYNQFVKNKTGNNKSKGKQFYMQGMGRKWDVFLYEEYVRNIGCIFY